MLLKVARFFICSVTIITLIWPVCFIHKTIIKIILEELAIPGDWLDKTCMYKQKNKRGLFGKFTKKDAPVQRASLLLKA